MSFEVVVVQRNYLEKAVNDQINVRVYLANGIKLDGKISKYDDVSMVLSKPVYPDQLVFLANVSTITPAQ